MLHVVLFTIISLPPIFTLVAASISHFLTAATKLSCYSSNEIDLICFFISGSSSFSVLERKNQLRCCFVSLKVRVAMRFTAETRGYWNAKYHPGLHEGVNVRTDDFLRTKISWMHSLPNFLTHGAPLRARELRYENDYLPITDSSFDPNDVKLFTSPRHFAIHTEKMDKIMAFI